MPLAEKHGKKLYRGFIDQPATRAARVHLLQDVLGLQSVRDASFGVDETRCGPWVPFALFEPGGRCVANVDAAVLPLVLDGVLGVASALRAVAVAPDWRGRGLFRNLMIEALDWCDAQKAEATFLYTAEPALYGRFGFRPVPQHALVGRAPPPSPLPQARRLDLFNALDRAIIGSLVDRRDPVSSHCALDVDALQFIDNLVKDEALVVVHATQPEALIVYEAGEDALVLVDVVAPVMPNLATVLGLVGLRPKRVKILVPADKLDWQGEAVPEDTGLMMRGTMPEAMTRPFMFPPTAEF